MGKFKKRIFEIIQIGNKGDLPSRIFDMVIVCTIVLNILTLFLETFNELEDMFTVFKAVETVTIVIFCIEYILRIWTAEYLYPDMSRARARLRFLLSFDGVVDL